MYKSANQPKKNKEHTPVPKDPETNPASVQFNDNRPEATAQAKFQEMANGYTSGQEHPIQKKENKTGMPDTLKSGIESLSGHSMDDVQVHYNSAKPAQLNAHAYAQGSEIHLAPGQEKHLPHEAWHVVQQKQGRVRPTKQLKEKVPVNDDTGLEKEADTMGALAASMFTKQNEPAQREALNYYSNSGVTQLVRVKLRDEDKDLMNELRHVPIHREGAENLDSPTGLQDFQGLSQIGASENIILEGHGNTNGLGVTHGQGGWSPKSLAQMANAIPKPPKWSGSIILLGCATGGIASQVSKEYYRLTKTPVTVTGTLKNIKVARNEHNENIIGSDWKHYPEEERPEDYAMAKKVEQGLLDFQTDCVDRLGAIIKAMISDDDSSVVIPFDILNLGLDSFKLTKYGRDMKFHWSERVLIQLNFEKIIKIITDNAEVVVGRILRVKNKKKGLLEIRGEAIDAYKPFALKWGVDYIRLLQQTRAFLLKPIDLSNPDHVKQSRMRETSKMGGLFGESWKDDMAE